MSQVSRVSSCSVSNINRLYSADQVCMWIVQGMKVMHFSPNMKDCWISASWSWRGEVMSPCWGFGYMDGLRRLPSFIKCGHWTQPDDKLILQKKRGGRPTTSLDFQSHKSRPSAAALKATSTSRAAPQQARRPKVTSNSHRHYKWVM